MHDVWFFLQHCTNHIESVAMATIICFVHRAVGSGIIAATPLGCVGQVASARSDDVDNPVTDSVQNAIAVRSKGLSAASYPSNSSIPGFPLLASLAGTA